MSAPVTVAACVRDAHYFLRQAEKALRLAQYHAPARVERPIARAGDHTTKLRQAVGRQVEQINHNQRRAA